MNIIAFLLSLFTPRVKTPAALPAAAKPKPVYVKQQVSKPRAIGATAFALAVASIATYEGYQPVGHHDPIDPPHVNTVCYGHIEGVQIGVHYTEGQCKVMLSDDLQRKYAPMVAKAVHVDMPPRRYAAILSFTYNIGGGALAKSTVARELNAGHVQAACDALLMWNKANGKVLRGLENRRKSEREWCLRND